MTTQTTFGVWLPQQRKARRLTQQAFAQHVGYAVSTIRKLESGHLRPSWQLLDRLTAALELTPLEQERLRRLAGLEPDAGIDNAEREVVPAPSPGLSSTNAGPPAFPTSIVGRAGDIAAVCALVRCPAVRLVTLTGPGGVGKTRLVVEVARALQDDFPDGVRYVELEQIGDLDLVAPALASKFGIAESDEAPVERLTGALRERQMLLVVDNFEQVRVAASLLSTLLSTAPGIKLVVTSRVTLRLRGEHVYPVAPLPLPAADGRAPIDMLLQNPAVALFVERAQSANPPFALSAANSAAVVELCIRLDGLPLAIELAAARSRLLNPREMLARIADRFRLLGPGPDDLPMRQRTLRATIDWSVELLQPADQELFTRVAVFPGGFTIEAAVAVAAPGAADDLDLLEHLATLVDNSLLRHEGGATAGEYREPRFTMLETIRAYALERLAEDAAAPTHQRHALYYLGLAEMAEPQLVGAEQQRWLERLDVEHDNLQAALRWTLERPMPDVALRLAKALGRFWWTRGYLREGRIWLERVLQVAATAPSDVRGRALYWLGILANRLGDAPGASEALATSRALCEQAGDRSGVALALNALGAVANALGDHAAARAYYEASLAIYEALADRERIATVLNNLGYTALLGDDHAQAAALLDESATIAEAIDDIQGLAFAHTNQGLVALRLGEYAHARTFLIAGLTLSASLGEVRNSAESLEALGELELVAGRPARGAWLLGAAAGLRDRIGVPLGPHERHRHAEISASGRTALGDADWQRAWTAGRGSSLDAAITYATSDVTNCGDYTS